MLVRPAKSTRPPASPDGRFAAIDFETADYGRDSACALAIVIGEGDRVLHQHSVLIRPPRRDFIFSYLHGITWDHVALEPSFADVWPSLAPLFDGVEFIAAHNASFDRSVLLHCCHLAGLPLPAAEFQCTVKLSRRAWCLDHAKLPDVCRHLGLPLNHHDAASDALACASIVLAARRLGFPLDSWLGRYTGRLPG